jgi:glucose-1-phosphate cytidylyltransferase
MNARKNNRTPMPSMKAVILAGGYGTRISEETAVRPKPMVEIGGKPILWHIMKIFAAQGVKDFIICLGYKGDIIKEYFANYHLRHSDVTIDLKKRDMTYHRNGAEDWRVTLVDTGESSLTGGRLKRAKDYIGKDTFFLTYGDGVADIDLKKLLEFHRANEVLATLTAVQPAGRFGALKLDREQALVKNFREKPKGDGAWISGGFFVLEPRALDYIKHDYITWEQEPMKRLAKEGRLAAYRHDGYWQNMDTIRDKAVLEDVWGTGKAPWKLWK